MDGGDRLRMVKIVSRVVLVLIIALLLVESAFSLQWPIAHDEAPLFYEAFLMRSEGRVPYRDIFDFQMPGSYAAYYWLGLFSDYDGRRIRILDLLLLAGLIAITSLAMRRFGWMPALGAGALFGLKYLEAGPSMSLQREYLLLVLISPAVWIALRGRLTSMDRVWLGLFFGLAAMVKPHAALGLVPILLLDTAGRIKSGSVAPLKGFFEGGLPTLGGFLLPVVVFTTWLGFSGALGPFIEIASNYWPLYAQISGEMIVNSGGRRWWFILDQLWRLGGNGWWLLSAGTGVYFALKQVDLRRPVYLLVGLTVCYALYPAFSGQFFPYHWLPFLYFVILLSALCLAELKWQAALALLLVVALAVRTPAAFLRQVEGKPFASGASRADQISVYLANHLDEDDTVQPLDWTGGALLAMLKTRTPIATRFVFDFYFYHHVSEPYVQDLRARFLKDLQASAPRFIIEVTAVDKPWVSGEDTSQEFPELRAFLQANYSIALRRDDFMIYQRH